MLPKHLLVYTLFPGLGIANCITHQQKTLAEFKKPFIGENRLNVVPLNETATSGILPLDVEQTVFRLGPRFANEFYANISADGELGFCLNGGCLSVVVKEVPCIVKAIQTKNPLELLKCGITKADLCKCIGCLPEALRKFVENFCATKDDDDVKDLYNYNTFYHLAEWDLNLQAFLGYAKNYQLEQNAELSCPIGQSCGSCSCCIGLCVLDTCVGGCLPI